MHGYRLRSSVVCPVFHAGCGPPAAYTGNSASNASGESARISAKAISPRSIVDVLPTQAALDTDRHRGDRKRGIISDLGGAASCLLEKGTDLALQGAVMQRREPPETGKCGLVDIPDV